MARPKKVVSAEKVVGVENTPATTLPEPLVNALKAGYTAYVDEDGEGWFFSEATAKKHFKNYRVITPKDLNENGTS